jgi:8-oxo-dGTP pyrophosphatase MutT (NUDIX family)
MEIPDVLEFKISGRNSERATASGIIGESNYALGQAYGIVHSAVMSPEKSGLRTVRPRVRIATFFPPTKISKRHGWEQVAAVCYRIRRSDIEFLLIQTRGGRWTFPKGGIEPGLTHAQAAALEAFEEAGVHGRIEESSFTYYTRRKRADVRGSVRSARKQIVVKAHLCEVLRLGPPQESNRNPTWFSAQRAKRRLQEDRKPEVGAELARVVELAMARIQQLREPTPEWTQKDALQKVQFENVQLTADPLARASFLKYIQARPNLRPSAAIELAVKAYLGQVLSLGRAQHFNQGLVQLPLKTSKRRSGRRTNVAAVRSPVQVIEIDNYPGSHAQNIASRNEGKKPRS